MTIGNLAGRTKFELGGGIWYEPNITNLFGPTGVGYPVEVEAGAHGVVTPAGTVLVGYGSGTNLVAAAEQPGYRLSAIWINGVVVWTNASGDNGMTVTNLATGSITNAMTYAFSFEPKTAQGQLAMNVQETVSAYAENIDPNHAGKERLYTLLVENLAPSSASEYNLIQFTLPGFASTNDIYGIILSQSFTDWVYSFQTGVGGQLSLVISPGLAGLPLASDGLTNGFERGEISFYTPHIAQQTNHATAVAAGGGPGGEIPFAPGGVVLPGPMPGVPWLSGEMAVGGGLVVTATNLSPGYGYTVEASTNLVTWTNAATFWATNASQPVPVPPFTNVPAQYYRLTCP